MESESPHDRTNLTIQYRVIQSNSVMVQYDYRSEDEFHPYAAGAGSE